MLSPLKYSGWVRIDHNIHSNPAIVASTTTTSVPPIVIPNSVIVK